MDVTQLREYIKEFQFEKLFIEALGWNNPQQQNSLAINLGSKKIQLSYIAQISGVPVLKFSLNNSVDVDNGVIKKLHQKIKEKHNKHLLLFASESEDYFSISYLSRENQQRVHHYFKDQSGDALISKLAGIHFGIEDKSSISTIGEKLDKAF